MEAREFLSTPLMLEEVGGWRKKKKTTPSIPLNAILRSEDEAVVVAPKDVIEGANGDGELLWR